MGERFGRYELLRRLAAGGMAEVLLARDLRDEGAPFVVIKRLLPELNAQPRMVDMFLDEAHLASRMSHPNIVRNSPPRRHEGRLYIVQEFVDGTNLGRLLGFLRDRRRRMPVEAAVAVTAAVADALDYAHRGVDPESGAALPIVHRDVTPRNILVGRDGAVKLTDFGIAKAADRRTQTMAGVAKGSIGYMSPEQAMVRRVDQRSDLFCLGVLLHEMLVGRPLFAGGADFVVLQRIVNQPAPAPSSLRPAADATLDAICLGLLEKRPEDRIQSAGELVDLLMDWLEGRGFADAQSVVAQWLSVLAAR